MNRKTIYGMAALFAGIVVAAVVGICTCHRQTSMWKDQARTAFHDALKEEMKRLRVDTVFYAMSGSGKVLEYNTLDTIAASQCYVTSQGKLTVNIPSRQLAHNPHKTNRLKAGALSFAFSLHPLSADTLLKHWRMKLDSLGIPLKTGIRVKHLHLDTQQTDSTIVPHDMLGADTLDYVTLGMACEWEVTALGVAPPWYRAFTHRQWLLLFLCLAMSSFLVAALPMAGTLCRRKLVREVKVEVSVPVVVAQSEHVRNFLLEDGALFKAEQQLLERNGCRKRLAAQQANLLLALLEKPEKALPKADLLSRLWPDGSGNDARLHTAVNRLNKSLEEISTYRVENQQGCYRLKTDKNTDEKSDKV